MEGPTGLVATAMSAAAAATSHLPLNLASGTSCWLPHSS